MLTTQHEAVFEWPHPEAGSVVLSGTFNDWALTFHLTKGPDGFSGRLTVPWGSKTAYKFIVDGTWVVRDDRPTEVDHDGNTNNVYIAPPEPSLGTNLSNDTTDVILEAQDGKQPANGKHAALEPPSRPASTSSFPQLVSDFADTVAARDGTSGAFDYVASGLGKAIHSVVGVDPINSDQIAIPTPLPTAETVPKEFNSPSSAVPSEASLSTRELANQPSEDMAIDNANNETQPVAPGVPVQILPVNAPEHNTTSQPSSPAPAIVADKVDGDEQPSTHKIVPVVNGIGSSPDEAKVREKAEETPLPAHSPDPAPSDADSSRPLTKTPKGFVTAEQAEEGRPGTTEPLKGVSDDVRATTTTPLEEPTIVVTNLEKTIDTPQVKTPDSDINPASVLAPKETSAEPAADSSAPPKEAIGTPQVNTPDSGLHPASVSVPKETPTGQGVNASVLSVGITDDSKPIGDGAQEIESAQTKTTAENADQATKLALQKSQALEVPFTEKGQNVVVPVVASVSSPEVPQSEAEPVGKYQPISAVTTKINEQPVPSPLVSVSEPTGENSAVQTEATRSTVNGQVDEGKSKQPERPSTPPKVFPTKQAFPSSGDSRSPSASPSSSKTGTTATRKKRQSIFGKLKHLFDHDKEKEKAKK